MLQMKLKELKRMLSNPHTPSEILQEPSYSKLTPLEKGTLKNLLTNNLKNNHYLLI